MTALQTILIVVVGLLVVFGLFLLIMLFRLGRSEQNLQQPSLGAEGGNLSPCPQTPNCISTQAPMEAGVNRAEPIILHDEPEEAFRKIADWIAAEPRAEVVERDDARYLRAEFRSRIFGFVDDFEVLLVQDEEKNILHVRSAARVGQGDMGVNRKRYETLRAIVEG